MASGPVYIRFPADREGCNRTGCEVSTELDDEARMAAAGGRSVGAPNATIFGKSVVSCGSRIFACRDTGGPMAETFARTVRATRKMIAIPSFREQIAIARFLDHINNRIDRYIHDKARLVGAVDRGPRRVGLLQEYRTRLIADVVTGKLDVGEAAKNLIGSACIEGGDRESTIQAATRLCIGEQSITQENSR